MSGISEIKPVTSEITGPGGNSQAKIPETRGEQTGCDSTAAISPPETRKLPTAWI